MFGIMNRVLEVTVVLVMAYLIIANAKNFSIAVQSIGGAYAGAVKVLQGR